MTVLYKSPNICGFLFATWCQNIVLVGFLWNTLIPFSQAPQLSQQQFSRCAFITLRFVFLLALLCSTASVPDKSFSSFAFLFCTQQASKVLFSFSIHLSLFCDPMLFSEVKLPQFSWRFFFSSFVSEFLLSLLLFCDLHFLQSIQCPNVIYMLLIHHQTNFSFLGIFVIFQICLQLCLSFRFVVWFSSSSWLFSSFEAFPKYKADLNWVELKQKSCGALFNICSGYFVLIFFFLLLAGWQKSKIVMIHNLQGFCQVDWWVVVFLVCLKLYNIKKRYQSYATFCAISFSARSLQVNAGSVLLLPSPMVACVDGVAVSIFLGSTFRPQTKTVHKGVGSSRGTITAQSRTDRFGPTLGSTAKPWTYAFQGRGSGSCAHGGPPVDITCPRVEL